MNNFKRSFQRVWLRKELFRYTNQIEEALKDANICFIFTEWKEIKKLNRKQLNS
ncbi:MAG: hypothetical protein ACLR8X_08130 [Gallintestinimicrobium sp.]